MEDILTLAVVNFHPVAGDKAGNLSRIKGFSRAAARQGAEIVLFPELCLMGYDYYLDGGISYGEKAVSAETMTSAPVMELQQLAKELGVYLIYGAAEAADGGILYNTAFLAAPDGTTQLYQKIHPFGDENAIFKKGERPVLLDTPWGPVGIGICYDSYQFPELMRYYTAKGARLYLNPTAEVEEIQYEGSRRSFRHYYQRNLEYGAASNGIYIASSNLTGFDKTSYFAGGSIILGPKITPFSELDVYCYAGGVGNTQEGISMATIDLSLASRMLLQESPHGAGTDYRPELYRTFQ